MPSELEKLRAWVVEDIEAQKRAGASKIGNEYLDGAEDTLKRVLREIDYIKKYPQAKVLYWLFAAGLTTVVTW